MVRSDRDAAQARLATTGARSPSSRCTRRSAIRTASARAFAPLSRLLRELLTDAADAGAITITDTRRATALVQQTVMYSWVGNRLVENPKQRLTAEETWEFCLHGLRG